MALFFLKLIGNGGRPEMMNRDLKIGEFTTTNCPFIGKTVKSVYDAYPYRSLSGVNRVAKSNWLDFEVVQLDENGLHSLSQFYRDNKTDTYRQVKL